GHYPLEADDPTRPVEAYWAHIDWTIEQAAALGLRIGLLPTWGDKWNKRWGIGPEIFNPDNAHHYGRWIGARYAAAGVIWIVGGDRPIESPVHRQIIDAMAAGIRAGDAGHHLMTFHPNGGHGSAEYLHDAPWIDFHMWQSGHNRNAPTYSHIRTDYARNDPVRPVLDGEPGYEDHPSAFKLENGYLEDYDCRKSFYWSVFSGACGYTYGAHPIWQFWHAGRKPLSFCRRDWIAALSLPGSAQLVHGRRLIQSRPYLERIPDQSIIASDSPEGAHHVTATRAADGSYAMIYLPYYNTVRIATHSLSGKTLQLWWFDPRTGVATRAETRARSDQPIELTPPQGEGPDWVLVIDDVARGFGAPGQ
ncbi:MAG TPA: glycoside hydrolase family 140 protein, partial [Tepidisphaeraceae bacterium]|nr:glycoside hydrolase family 140 protein [Tepidisphaeraceae bacterium]